MENVRSPHMEEWKGGEKNPCGKKQRLILRWNFLSSFQCIGKNMCGGTDYRRLPVQTLFWSVPVMLDRDSSSWAALGPRAMVWMTAPLCLTSSKQDLIWPSSPSVSNTISEPEVVWLLEVIAWTGKATLLITGKWFLNKWKARKSCGLVLGGVVRLPLQSERKRIFVLLFQAAILVYRVFPRGTELAQRAGKGAAFISQMTVLIRLESY